jgi:endo-1,4-beta-xylanase
VITLNGRGMHIISVSLLFLAVFLIGVMAYGQTTIREAAFRHSLLVGAAAEADELGNRNPLEEPAYAVTLATQYNMLGPENAMKWIYVHPAPDIYDFAHADQLVAFAEAHGMQVRGHTLCWRAANPDWLTNLAKTASPSTMALVMRDHITSVVTHYKSRVFAWDVVNEAVGDRATGIGTDLQDSIWFNQPGIGLPGTGYIEQAFRWAHAADPNALLFYNECGIEAPSPKFQAVYNMLKDFVSRGVPIHGVGLQMHTDAGDDPTSAGLTQTIQQITALGLQVHITEMDVRVEVNSLGVASTTALKSQAEKYQRILTVCLQNPGCKAFQMWGFTDKYSWIPSYFPGFGAALPFDTQYQPKSAFFAMLDTLIKLATPLAAPQKLHLYIPPK